MKGKGAFPHLPALPPGKFPSSGGKGGLAAVNSMAPAPATSVDVLVRPATTELRLLSNKSPQIPKHIFKIYFQNYTEHNSTNQ